MFKATCVVGILSLGATFVIGYLLELRHVTRLPEAGVGVLVGIVASGLTALSGNEQMLEHEKFDFEVRTRRLHCTQMPGRALGRFPLARRA